MTSAQAPLAGPVAFEPKDGIAYVRVGRQRPAGALLAPAGRESCGASGRARSDPTSGRGLRFREHRNGD